MSHPFRFGVTASAITDPARFRELAKKAEDLGYSTLSMADHLDGQLAPLLALGAAASVTNHLKLLPLVLANDFRHPAVLAKEAATLHQLSGGRLELGVGAGWMVADYTHAGIPYATAGQRIERLEESVQILTRAFSGGPVHHRGTHYQIDGLVNAPRPWNDDHIPLLVAGGRRRILQLAATYADIVGLNPGLGAGVIDNRVGATASAAATDEKLGWIAEAAGDRRDLLELQTRVHVARVGQRDDGTLGRVADAMGLSRLDAAQSPHVLIGSEQHCIETLNGWRDRWGISYVGISADAIDQMAGVVAALSGT